MNASLSGSQTQQDETATVYSMVSVISNIQKEQLCTNASILLGWRRGPPPYVDHFDVTAAYSNTFVAPPSLFPPLSLLHQNDTLPVDAESLQVLEDVQLVAPAFLPEDPDILPLLKVAEWNELYPALDNLKKLRLIGGLGKRIMGLDRLLHWELRQSLEGYLGFVLHCIVSGECSMTALLLSDALLAIGIRVQGKGCSSMMVTDIDKHAEKGFQASRLAITDRWGMYREFNGSGTHLHARV